MAHCVGVSVQASGSGEQEEEEGKFSLIVKNGGRSGIGMGKELERGMG